MSRNPTHVLAAAALVFALAAAIAVDDTLSAQAAGTRHAKDGVYTPAQAARGAQVFRESCSKCHGEDLSGGLYDGDEVPALHRDDFMVSGDLAGLFARIKRSMPRDAPSSLPDRGYLDVIAFLLQQNDYPEGATEIPVDVPGLTAIRVGRGGPAPNFSLVEVVGCLATGPGNAVVLTSGSEPVIADAASLTPAAIAEAATHALGSETFVLVNAPASAASHQGHKMVTRGLLIRSASDVRVNVMALEMMTSSCP